MPTLMQFHCTVELGATNLPLQEYATKYYDGAVSCYIPVLETEVPFSIHLTSQGHIATGLAVFVFIDGKYQCNRNIATQAWFRKDTQKAPETRMRQKEEKLPDGQFLGRPWTFAKLEIEKKSSSRDKQFEDNVGTIEVVVLRCDYDRDAEDNARLGLDGANEYDMTSSEYCHGTDVELNAFDNEQSSFEIPPPPSTFSSDIDNDSENDPSVTMSTVGDSIQHVEASAFRRDPHICANGYFGLDGASDDGELKEKVKTAMASIEEHEKELKKKGIKVDYLKVLMERHTNVADLDFGNLDEMQIDYLREKTRRLDREYRDYHGSSHSRSRKTTSTRFSNDDFTLSTRDSSSDRRKRKTTHDASKAHVKPYWNEWNKDYSQDRSDGLVNAYKMPRPVAITPALPQPAVSPKAHVKTDCGMQAGEGARYLHQTLQPTYLDTMQAPYAVFTFKYCSMKKLESILGHKLDDSVKQDVQNIRKQQLFGKSKNDLVEELMRLRAGGRRRSSYSQSSSSAADSTSSNDSTPPSGSSSSTSGSCHSADHWGTTKSAKTQSGKKRKDNSEKKEKESKKSEKKSEKQKSEKKSEHNDGWANNDTTSKKSKVKTDRAWGKSAKKGEKSEKSKSKTENQDASTPVWDDSPGAGAGAPPNTQW